MESHVFRRRLHRFDQPGHARFLTFSCYHRLPLLNHEGIRELFVQRLEEVRQDYHMDLIAWVIMPEHVHLLVFSKDMPSMTRWTHALKRPFAEAVLRRWKQLDAPILRQVRHGNGFRYWQTGGGYDRNLISSADIREKMQYIHENPVRRGLAAIATDYPWSSARWYAGLPDAKLPCDSMPV